MISWQDKISIAGMVISIIGLIISVFIIIIQGWFYLRNQKKFFMIEKINSYNETFLKETGLWDPTTKRLELYCNVQQNISFYDTKYKNIKKAFLEMQMKKLINKLNIGGITFEKKKWIAEGKNDLIFIESFSRKDIGSGVHWKYKPLKKNDGKRISIFFRLDQMSFTIQGNDQKIQKKIDKKRSILLDNTHDQQKCLSEMLTNIINGNTKKQKRKIKRIFKIK